MQFDVKDLEAVARSRVGRWEAKKTMYFMVAVAALIVGGLLAVRANTAVGWILCIAGVLIFLWYQRGLSQKANIVRDQLIAQQQQENDKAQVETVK